MTTGELVAKLKTMSGKSGQALYERLCIAREVLKDHEYIESHWNDEANAMEQMQADLFGDCGRHLSLMLAVLVDFPDEKDWKNRNWNFQRLLAEYETRRRKETPAETVGGERTRITKADHEKLQCQLQEAQTILRHTAKEKDAVLSEADKLRELVAQLERENIELRAKVDELEHLLEGRLTRAGR